MFVHNLELNYSADSTLYNNNDQENEQEVETSLKNSGIRFDNDFEMESKYHVEY